jgi:hypothetical protein
MAERGAVRTLVLLAMNVGIVAPHIAHAQPFAEREISCDAGDTLEAALASLSPNGRIIIRSGTCVGNLTIDRDVRIQGAGYDRVTLKAADPAQPVLTIPFGITATISGVLVTGGRVGISTTGRVSLAFSLIAENSAGGIEVRDTGSLDGDKLKVARNTGPGILVVRGDATLRGSLVSGNKTNGDGGAGLLVIGGRVDLIGTQIEENEAVRNGGGLLVIQKGIVSLDRVRLFKNVSLTGHGGALAVQASTVDITGSSLFENATRNGNGGAIAVLGDGEARIDSSTFSANTAAAEAGSETGGLGGGVYVDKHSKATLLHATLVLNQARIGGAIASDNTVFVGASLLSGNRDATMAGECGGKGRVESKGWNLLLNVGDCRFMSKPGDLIGASPRLGAPGPYGGTWNTVPLRAGSPAIDRIPLTACRGGFDQRAKPRPANGNCDVGAFERQPEDVMPE